jgi:hypothetical protein
VSDESVVVSIFQRDEDQKPIYEKEDIQMRVITSLIGSCLLALFFCAECSGNDTIAGKVVTQDLKTAYDIAQTLFTDNPTGAVTLSGLESYGFHPSNNVRIRILDGYKDGLKILGVSIPGHKKYVIDKHGQIEVESLERRTEAAGRSGAK